MRVYHPLVEVRLLKQRRRTEMAPGMPAAARLSAFDELDLTSYLVDGGAVIVSKSVREPAGTFSLQFADKGAHYPGQGALDTLYGLIEPMDILEIRFCHDPVRDRDEGERVRPPIVMRGLVSEVRRDEDMQGGRPHRRVSVLGHDFGKILQLIRIYYLNNSVVGDNILSELAFFHKYAEGGAAKIKPALDFLWGVVSNIIIPYLRRFTTFSAAAADALAIDEMGLECTIEGSVSPFLVSSLNEVSLYELLATVLDVGFFNELFVEDRDKGLVLVARPSPLLGVDGEPLQGQVPQTVEIRSEEIVSLSVSRSDAGLANYYWVGMAPWSMLHNEDARRLASVGSASSFILFDYLNTEARHFGIRKMEVESRLGPPDYPWPDSQKREQIADNTRRLTAWIEKRRELLAKANRDNLVLESGTLHLRGNHAIRPGMRLKVVRGKVTSYWYAVGVTHRVSPFGLFETSVTVERGSGYVARSMERLPAYRSEIDPWGVS